MSNLKPVGYRSRVLVDKNGKSHKVKVPVYGPPNKDTVILRRENVRRQPKVGKTQKLKRTR